MERFPAPGEAREEVRENKRPALLCLHGLTAHGGSWDAVACLLADRVPVHAPDLPGRGRSPLPSAGERFRLEEEVARLRPLARRLSGGPDGYLAVGHSQGAALALALAAGPHPPRALLLVNPVTPWTHRPSFLSLLHLAPVRRALLPVLVRWRRPLARWVLEQRVFGDSAAVDAATVERYAVPWAGPERVDAILRAVADWRPAALAAHLPAAPPPTLVLAGERDRRTPAEEARRLARRLRADVLVAEGAGHALPEERPQVVADAVRSLVERGGPTGTRSRPEPAPDVEE